MNSLVLIFLILLVIFVVFLIIRKKKKSKYTEKQPQVNITQVLKISEEKDKQIEQLTKELEIRPEPRSIPNAFKTKEGDLYIISNIGSFGENMFKIGCTQRLDKEGNWDYEHRINELGDASVPFKFDIHCIIHSLDVKKLEKDFHEYFKDQKVNLVRKKGSEFFYTTIEEIKKSLEYFQIDVEFTDIPEAKEYRQTLKIREEIKNQN